MSSLELPDFNKPGISLNSTMNDSYATADEDNTHYYSTHEITDTTIEANNTDECIDDIKLQDIPTNPSSVDLVSNIENIEPISSIEVASGNDSTLTESITENRDTTPAISKTDTTDNILFGDTTGEMYDTPDGKVLLYKIEGSEEIFAVPVDSEQCKELSSETKENPKESEDSDTKSQKLVNLPTAPNEKESDTSDNYVEEYLDEEFLEYETVDGEPVTGDNPRNTIITPSESDDDASDDSPVMAYLEKNENLNFFKNNPDAIGIPMHEAKDTPLIKKGILNKRTNIASDNVVPLTNGITSVLLTSCKNTVPKYQKLIMKTKSASAPKFALIKELNLYNALSKEGRAISSEDQSKLILMNLDAGEIENKNESVPTIKKPRERKQVLEPAVVDVVFELEKIKQEEAVKKAKKKTAAKSIKDKLETDYTDTNVSESPKVKRKWTRKRVEHIIPVESPVIPQRTSKRLSGKRNKKKTCAIASCKCDLNHSISSSDETESDEKELEKCDNISEYSDDFQLSPKSISFSSQPKVKVYSNVRKRHHSQKSTYEEDEDEMSNDLLTLMKEDEKSTKEIDLNKEFPEKGTPVTTPVTTPVKKSKVITNKVDEKVIKVLQMIENMNHKNITTRSRISLNDSSVAMDESFTLINENDVQEFTGFVASPLISSRDINEPSSTRQLSENKMNGEVIENAFANASSNSKKLKTPLKRLQNSSKLHNKSAAKSKNIACRSCKKSFRSTVHLTLHEQSHKKPKNPISNSSTRKLKLKTPKRTNPIRHTPLTNHGKRKDKVSPFRKPHDKSNVIKAKKPVTPPKRIMNRKLTTLKEINLSVPKTKFGIRPSIARTDTMTRRSNSVLQEISKSNNNVKLSTKSQPHLSELLKCENCDLTFKTSLGLLKHKSTHKSIRNKTCAKCSKKFLSDNMLSKHVKTCQIGKSVKARPVSVSDLNTLLSSSKSTPKRRAAHSGVPMSSKMLKALESIKNIK